MPFQEDDGKPISEAILAKKMEHTMRFSKSFAKNFVYKEVSACVITHVSNRVRAS